MKLVNRARLATTLMLAALLGLGSMAANAAANTPANTSIANKATVNYSIGAIAQTPIESKPGGNSTPGVGNGLPTTFVVDAKLVLAVTTVDAASVNVTPGQTGAVLVYKVTNTGNDTQGVSFTTLAKATGTDNPFSTSLSKDNFDSGSVNVFVSKTNVTTYASGTDTATAISQLAPGASAYVFVVSTIPVAQINQDTAVMALVAQVATAGAAGYTSSPGADITSDDRANPWTPTTVQHIFADAAGSDDGVLDGKSSSRDAYLVKSASLTITKTSSVLTDPVNCTTAGLASSCTSGAVLHAIPGAVMQYTISVANASTASSNASSIAINDSLSSMLTNVTWNSKLAVASTGTGNASGNCADAGTTLSATSPYTAVTCGYSSSTVSVTGITLQPSDTATITFNVTIQ